MESINVDSSVAKQLLDRKEQLHNQKIDREEHDADCLRCEEHHIAKAKLYNCKAK